MVTVVLGLPPGVPCFSISWTILSPWMTRPNTTCFPSSDSAWAVVIKNCDPLVFGPAFAWSKMIKSGQHEILMKAGLIVSFLIVHKYNPHHRQYSWSSMLLRKVLVLKLPSVNWLAASSVPFSDVSSLKYWQCLTKWMLHIFISKWRITHYLLVSWIGVRCSERLIPNSVGAGQSRRFPSLQCTKHESFRLFAERCHCTTGIAESSCPSDSNNSLGSIFNSRTSITIRPAGKLPMERLKKTSGRAGILEEDWQEEKGEEGEARERALTSRRTRITTYGKARVLSFERVKFEWARRQRHTR